MTTGELSDELINELADELLATTLNEEEVHEFIHETKKLIKEKEELFKKESMAQIADEEFLNRSYNI